MKPEIKHGYYMTAKMYPLDGRKCSCGNGASVRHHIDGDPTNYDRDNIDFNCMRCHRRGHSKLSEKAIANIVEFTAIKPKMMAQYYDVTVRYIQYIRRGDRLR